MARRHQGEGDMGMYNDGEFLAGLNSLSGECSDDARLE